uniref:Phage protein n=1 Tax=Panagrellus redivivus TaxID=6233 RepID=A0A7E4UR83_PANRE
MTVAIKVFNEVFHVSLTMSRRPTTTYRVTKTNYPPLATLYNYKKLIYDVKPKYLRHCYEDDLIDYASWTVADFYPDKF